MAGKFSFTLKEYQEAAVKYRADLLMLPIIGIGDTLQHMTGRPGIRYKERVGNLTGDAQFAPYNPQRAVDYNLGTEFRDLETYFGSVVANFEPNSAISTLLGTGASGDCLGWTSSSVRASALPQPLLPQTPRPWSLEARPVL